MAHHTKDKGDIGVVNVIARPTELGWRVGVPITEHAKYDLFAEKEGVVHTVQVKYATPKTDDYVKLVLTNCWTDRKGTHARVRKVGDYSMLAIYVPNKGAFFVPDAALGERARNVTL